METSYRLFSGVLTALFALFTPIAPLLISTLVFIFIDFLTGVFADRRTTLRKGEAWYFESHKAWRTILKAGLALTSIVMAWLLEHYILTFLTLHAARLTAGFICGVELWSFLENASELSDAPIFRILRRYAHRQIRQHLDH